MTQNKAKSIFSADWQQRSKILNVHQKGNWKNPGKLFSARDICVRYTRDCVSECIFAIDSWYFKRFGNLCHGWSNDPKHLWRSDESLSQTNFLIHVMEKALKHRIDNRIEQDDFLNHILKMRNNNLQFFLLFWEHFINWWLYESNSEKKTFYKTSFSSDSYCNGVTFSYLGDKRQDILVIIFSFEVNFWRARYNFSCSIQSVSRSALKWDDK